MECILLVKSRSKLWIRHLFTGMNPGSGPGPYHRGKRRRVERKAINMRLKYFYLSVFPLLFFYVVLFGATAEADMYIYKDKKGHMVITDSPPDNVGKMEIIKDGGGMSSRPAGFRDIETDVTAKYRTKSNTERDSLGTVTVKSSISQGSGFFINENGYILTNTHVPRLDETEMKKREKDIGRADQKREHDRAAVTMEERQSAVKPPVIAKAKSAAFKYSDNVIQVPADIERR